MALTDTGLVVRYPLDEAASGDPTTVVDVSSNGYDLTDSVTGKSGAWVNSSYKATLGEAL